MAEYLGPRYHVVVANPPYMGGKGMNGRLSAWAKENYPNSKSDLFAMFIERNLDLALPGGAVAMITKIGRAHVCTPVTNAQLVCRLLLEKKNLQLDHYLSSVPSPALSPY